ncbi:MAG: Zn-dependent hydrolase of the beta-lactamase fold-like protein [uncultured bacterium]|nr:MAG: Zn-dependent hydrolase of the beta-lactamase fold-like protein [uncultured bacterium]
MQIIWHGLSCIEITAKTQDEEAKLVINPYENSTGLRFPRTLEPDIIVSTHDADDAHNKDLEKEKGFVVSHAGEYEVKGAFVYGISAPLAKESDYSKSHTIYRIEAEGMRLVHLGVLDRDLTDIELEQLQSADILFLPVGGGRVLDPKKALEVFEKIEPRIIIPIMVTSPNLKEKLGTVEAFCNQLGTCKKETATKYRIARKDLPQEDMMVVVLERD